jgi:hypothetical protein
MTEWSDFLSVSNLGATGLLAITVLLVLFGRLQPKSNVMLWQNAYTKAMESLAERDKQISDLIEANRVAARALDALPAAARKAGGEHASSPDRASADAVQEP